MSRRFSALTDRTSPEPQSFADRSDGLKRRGDGGRNITFRARQYFVNGERRSFALLRPIADIAAQHRIGEVVLAAYAEFEERTEPNA